MIKANGTTPKITLKTPLVDLPGIYADDADAAAAVGIHTVEDVFDKLVRSKRKLADGTVVLDLSVHGLYHETGDRIERIVLSLSVERPKNLVALIGDDSTGADPVVTASSEPEPQPNWFRKYWDGLTDKPETV